MNRDPGLRSVLFVCMGNICRSPAAEGVMRSWVAEEDREDRIAIDSAGTLGYHAGNPADSRMRRAAAARGYDLTSRARQVERRDLQIFDLVVAMDEENYRDLEELDSEPRAAIRMLSDFLPADRPRDVPDPYYGGPQGFETVLDLLEEACPKIAEALLEGDL